MNRFEKRYPAKAQQLSDEERRLCGEYWAWLYDERKRRDGTEPTPEEKRAHPAHVALLALRKANPAYFGSE